MIVVKQAEEMVERKREERVAIGDAVLSSRRKKLNPEGRILIREQGQSVRNPIVISFGLMYWFGCCKQISLLEGAYNLVFHSPLRASRKTTNGARTRSRVRATQALPIQPASNPLSLGWHHTSYLSTSTSALSTE